MGNNHSQPKNRTGKNVVKQKLEHAKKTGVLSLREHKLDEIPDAVFELTTLTTLDISHNSLKTLGRRLSSLSKIKSLQCDDNKLTRGSLSPVTSLAKLQSLSAGGNQLGKVPTPPSSGKGATSTPAPKATAAPAKEVPVLPPSLKQLKLDRNFFNSVPMEICSPTLTKLEKLDLSLNNLASIPREIANLVALVELNLNGNSIVSLPAEIGALVKLKVLSLKNNNISGGTSFSDKNPQPLPAALFSETPVIDLNLHGNKLTFKEISEFEGFADFLERRKKVKSKDLYGGALTNLDVCGLE